MADVENTQDATAKREAHLHELVLRHGMRYEVRPEKEMHDDALVRVGFDLVLYGVHEHPSKSVIPGCAECEKVFAAMREVADWLLPPDNRPSRYEVEGYDHSLRMAPDNKDRDEVRLEVRILHRHDFFGPIDQCEERCLREMVEKLRRLGAREGALRPRGSHAVEPSRVP